VARRLLTDSDDGVIAAEATALTGNPADRPPLRRRLTRVARSVARRLLPLVARNAMRNHLLPPPEAPDVSATRPTFLRDLRARAASISPRPPLHSSVHVNGSSGQDGMDAARRRAVEYAVSCVGPASVFEVSYESPFYATLAARAGVRSVAVGVDETHVDALYRHAREHRFDLLPLVMDIRNPSPAFGLCGQTAAPATTRLASDLVIALDATHHLGVRYRLNFDQVAAGLSTFARRALLIDFVDGAHPSTRAYLTADFAGYTSANFEAALRRQFPRVERVANTDRPTFLCFKEAAAE
jgi:hypothetical protein